MRERVYLNIIHSVTTYPYLSRPVTLVYPAPLLNTSTSPWPAQRPANPADGSFTVGVRGENEKFINQRTDNHNERASRGVMLIEKFIEGHRVCISGCVN